MKKFVACVLAVFAASVLWGAAGTAAISAAAAESEPNHRLGAELVTFVDDTTDLSSKLHTGGEEDYYPSSRQWNGITTVISAGENVFVGWYTGGEREPDNDNYIVIAASEDGGDTWIDPFIIIDPPASAQKVVLPLFYYNDLGELWLWFEHSSLGFMGMRFYGAAGPLEEIRCDQPKQVGPIETFNKPTVLSDGSILYTTTAHPNINNTAVYRSVDHGNSFTLYSEIQSYSTAKVYNEAQVVELSDGRIMNLCRIESGIDGGLERAYSSDKGKTWTPAEHSLPDPLISPGSRIAIIRLQSGALCFATNANLTARTNMRVYLSYDDGETWPYSLEIDSGLSAYPDLYQASDGKIYLSYDKGRYLENSIRLTLLTEEDIRAGDFVTDESKDKVIITRANGDYGDIVSVNGAFESEYTYPVGTDSAEIRGELPTSVTVTDDQGREYTLEGTWRSSGFDASEAGTYTFTFNTTLPATLLDSHNLLRVRITLSETEGGGCAGILYSSGACMGGMLLAVTAALLLKSNKNREGN